MKTMLVVLMQAKSSSGDRVRPMLIVDADDRGLTEAVDCARLIRCYNLEDISNINASIIRMYEGIPQHKGDPEVLYAYHFDGKTWAEQWINVAASNRYHELTSKS